MKNIIIFGPPGSGKGTMSQKIAEEFELRHISTGDIIRKNQSEGTKLGKIADQVRVDQGNLLPDDVINEMIKQAIIDDGACKGFIFDGFPRTAGQAKMLDQFLNSRGTPINTVLYLNTPKWVVQNRIIERGKTSGRKDDTLEAFPTRWDAYQKQTVPALTYFEGRGKVKEVNGEKTIDEVYTELKKIINEN